jgi:HAD superfamily hydrolase (TIGR01509 family)
MTFRSIIFDFNGVLLFDAALQVQSWQGVAKDLRGHEMTEEELRVHMHGRPNSYVLSFLAGRQFAGPELQELVQRKESFYRELWLKTPRNFVLSPGAESLLDELADKDIPRTIATSSEKTNLDFFIEHLHLEQWFDLTHIVYDDGFRPGKPAPDIYLAAARNLHLTPAECIVIEDAVSGIQAARAARIGYIVGIGAHETHRKRLARDGASSVIESLHRFSRALLNL